MSMAPGPNRVSLVPQEDFLFHLYRGSELLQENRVLEAKEELEFALTMQPLDPKGQELLGTVYFRVGLYPRAIQIYEGLANQFPKDVAIKVNLALCYMKTGQPEPARQTLREAVDLNPSHKRAWGYLGLALQKLGEFEEAQIAFQRGGHLTMAKRLIERRQRSSHPPPPLRSPPDETRQAAVADVVFSELDTEELSLAPPGTPTPPPAAASAEELAGAGAGHSPLVLPDDQTIGKRGNDVLLVRVEEAQSFAVRLDALRVIAGTASTRALHRNSGGAETDEVLGGIGSPMVRVIGGAELVLAARSRRELSVITLDDEPICVLEDMLLAFDLRLSYENARVRLEGAQGAQGEGARTSAEAGSQTVQFRGDGSLVLELSGKLGGVPCTLGRPLLVRREWIVGWLGELVARALPPAESPNGQRGLVGFAGDGTVLLCSGANTG